MTPIPKYMDKDGNTVEFHRLPDKLVNGCSHRVLVNGVPKDWHDKNKKPSARVAKGYLERHNGR